MSEKQDNRTLRTLIITALTETGQTRDTLYAKIGEFYYCAAPKYLYKYYSENPLNMDAIKNHEMRDSAPCNFNDVFDCDVSINEKAIFESFFKCRSSRTPERLPRKSNVDKTKK